MTPAGITEQPEDGPIPRWTNPEWRQRFPWLVQGTTGQRDAAEPFDLGLSGAAPVGRVLERWRALGCATGMPHLVHARQVHAADLYVHPDVGPPGLLVMEGVDGHLTRRPGVLLTVSVADCVPVSLVDPERRAVALLHAGWRGAAAGIVERATTRLGEQFGSRAEDIWLHCGPAICGDCYEVGPEVHRALRPGADPPRAPTPVDLRAAIAERASAAGVPQRQITLSTHCTRCGPGAFFSHRGGSQARQMGFLGIRE